MSIPAVASAATFKFDVASPSQRSRFLDFIHRDVRRNLQDRHRPPIVLGRAVRLPPEADDPADTELIDLILLAGDIGITLRLRADNLNAVGFRNGSLTWLEFSHDHTRGPLIKSDPKEWKSLPFNGSYTSTGIGTLHDEQNAVVLGHTAVVEAITGLAGYGGADDKVAKRWLRTLFVTFIESIRLDAIAHRVDGQMRHPSSDIDGRQLELTAEHIILIYNWGKLSQALLIAANQPLAEDFRSFVFMDIHNAHSAAAAMGMVLVERKKTADDGTAGRRRKRPSMAIQDMNLQPDMVGLRLVQVVGVRIGDIEKPEKTRNIYGWISITDSLGTDMLFRRDKHNGQLVGPGGQADLVWPSRAINGADDFVINLKLMDYDDVAGRMDPVASGPVVWNSRDTLRSDHDTVKSIQVKGGHGSSVQVQFAVLTRAVVAFLEVVMVDDNGKAVSDVYGTITARTTMVSGETLEYKLFDRVRADDVSVRRNADVPLKGKVISATLQSVLEIEANLWDIDGFARHAPDEQIALGSAMFYPRLGGSSRAEIKGKYGKVNVKVTWSTTFLPVSMIKY